MVRAYELDRPRAEPLTARRDDERAAAILERERLRDRGARPVVLDDERVAVEAAGHVIPATRIPELPAQRDELELAVPAIQNPDQAGALVDADPTREHQLAHHPSAAEPVLMEGGIAVVDHPAAVERLALEPAPIAPALTVVVAPSVIAAPAGIAQP